MTSMTDQQKDLIRDRFTRTAEVFGDYAVAERAREAELLAKLLDLRGDETSSGSRVRAGHSGAAIRAARALDLRAGFDSGDSQARASLGSGGRAFAIIDFAIGDAQALPFADGSLDIAITSYSLHHMSDAARVIGEMARVVQAWRARGRDRYSRAGGSRRRQSSIIASSGCAMLRTRAR